MSLIVYAYIYNKIDKLTEVRDLLIPRAIEHFYLSK